MNKNDSDHDMQRLEHTCICISMFVYVQFVHVVVRVCVCTSRDCNSLASDIFRSFWLDV